MGHMCTALQEVLQEGDWPVAKTIFMGTSEKLVGAWWEESFVRSRSECWCCCVAVWTMRLGRGLAS